jgi:myo-inositol-1(or 4)-monophosphatase
VIAPFEFAIKLSYKVGDILRDRFTSGILNSERKPDNSIVTESDLLAEDIIVRSIQEEFPDDNILSEELNTRFVPKNNVTWVVDPLDGTTNFALGLEYWGVSIARIEGGQVQSATAYFPLLDEMYSAELLHGSFMNGKQIQTKGPNPEQPAAFFSCCSRTFRRYLVNIPYKTRILGSAVYTMCSVARGLAVLGFEANPKIWDIAAGWLIVMEAGGIVETLDNKHVFPLTKDIDYSKEDFPTLAASSQKLMTKARKQIKPKP